MVKPKGACPLNFTGFRLKRAYGRTITPTVPVGSVRSPNLLHRPLAVACLSYLALLAGVAVVAPLLFPHVADEHAGDLLAALQLPSGNHWLGTDSLGRDVLERLLVGTRVTIVGVVEALVVVLALGVPFGLMAGYFGGWLDRIVSWLADMTFSMPGIVVVLVVLSVFPQSMAAGMITLGVFAAPGLMRVVRSATLPVREELYIAAAQVSGLSRSYIITRHVLPRISGVVIVQASLLAGLPCWCKVAWGSWIWWCRHQRLAGGNDRGRGKGHRAATVADMAAWHHGGLYYSGAWCARRRGSGSDDRKLVTFCSPRKTFTPESTAVRGAASVVRAQVPASRGGAARG